MKLFQAICTKDQSKNTEKLVPIKGYKYLVGKNEPGEVRVIGTFLDTSSKKEAPSKEVLFSQEFCRKNFIIIRDEQFIRSYDDIREELPKLGDVVRIHAGAPGIGYWEYVITSLRGRKALGVLIKDTVRTLDVTDVI